jgi:hypothetical protein
MEVSVSFKTLSLCPGMATVPFVQNAIWTPESASAIRTETFLAPARNLTKFLKLFGSILIHYTDGDVLAQISLPIKLQS